MYISNQNMSELFKISDRLEKKYENHFKIPFPERIIGWWEPLNVTNYTELFEGVKAKEHDIEQAIRTNTPIPEIPEKEWKQIIF